MSATPQVLLGHHLKALRLPTFVREYDKVARQCAAEGVDHVRYLLRLAELEMIDREQRLVERRIRAARFPAVKSLDSYDSTALPSLNKVLVLELARCEYLARRENVEEQGRDEHQPGEAEVLARAEVGRAKAAADVGEANRKKDDPDHDQKGAGDDRREQEADVAEPEADRRHREPADERGAEHGRP